MKNKRLWVFLEGLVILSTAFLFLNFHLAVSKVVMTGEFLVNSHSWGIISRPGDHQILADELARRIGEILQTLYLGS